MQKELLDRLREVTPEEARLLAGGTVDKSIYQSSEAGNQIDAALLLEQGKLITIRKHTRFVHFPEHTHNYVEILYMCSGSTRHIINGAEVLLKAGELLFLNQNATQEIDAASEEDIGVNFIILPEFFDRVLKMLDEEENPLRAFVADCMTGANPQFGYLHFKAASVLPVQNLVENLIWSLAERQPNRRSINQITMGLLLLQLMNCLDAAETDGQAKEQRVLLQALSYIDGHYRNGSLRELAEILHYDEYWLSREIRRRSGKTYTQLLQQKRLSQAAYLLKHTRSPVADIAVAVGYENISYFHRIFREAYNCSPREYRLQERTLF